MANELTEKRINVVYGRAKHSFRTTISIGMAAVALATSAEAAIYTVQTNADAGIGSLRWAIQQANTNQGLDDIEFQIPGAVPHMITLNTQLPEITDEVRIEGYSQPGASQAAENQIAHLMIVIDAGLVIAGQARNGLVLKTNNSVVRGLVIQNALGFGIRVLGDGNHIAGNVIGIDQKTGVPTDLFLANDGDGVHIRGDDNVVGGFGPEDRNVISGTASSTRLAPTASRSLAIAMRLGAIRSAAIPSGKLSSTLPSATTAPVCGWRETIIMSVGRTRVPAT